MLTSLLFISHAQNIEVKNSIENSFYNLNGEVTTIKINSLILDLKKLSADSTMCFYSLFDYNNCNSDSDAVYDKVASYLNDLINKSVDVKLTKWNKPWEDENFYTLRFEIYYANDNPKFPVDLNFDSFILDVSEDRIKNIILAREWIELSKYAN